MRPEEPKFEAEGRERGMGVLGCGKICILDALRAQNASYGGKCPVNLGLLGHAPSAPLATPMLCSCYGLEC